MPRGVQDVLKCGVVTTHYELSNEAAPDTVALPKPRWMQLNPKVLLDQIAVNYPGIFSTPWCWDGLAKEH